MKLQNPTAFVRLIVQVDGDEYAVRHFSEFDMGFLAQNMCAGEGWVEDYIRDASSLVEDIIKENAETRKDGFHEIIFAIKITGHQYWTDCGYEYDSDEEWEVLKSRTLEKEDVKWVEETLLFDEDPEDVSWNTFT